jgi:hypothetical protein
MAGFQVTAEGLTTWLARTIMMAGDGVRLPTVSALETNNSYSSE